MARPVKYKTPEDMQEVIDKYFESVTLVDDNGVVKSFKPTVQGLAYALDMSRMGLLKYEGKPEFVYTVKRAKQRVAIALETRLYENNVAGIIFNLKNNFGMVDKQELEQTGKLTVNNTNKKPTRAELLAIINQETSG